MGKIYLLSINYANFGAFTTKPTIKSHICPNTKRPQCFETLVCGCVCVGRACVCVCVCACVIDKLWLHAFWEGVVWDRTTSLPPPKLQGLAASLAFLRPHPWSLLLLPQLSGNPTLPTLSWHAVYSLRTVVEMLRTVPPIHLAESWLEWSISGYGKTSKQRLC